MRKSQTGRNRDLNKKIETMFMLFQIFIISCTSIYILIFFTSDTRAAFFKKEETFIKVQSKTWWENSELKIIGTNHQNKESCLPTTITVYVQNIGLSMNEASSYEIYYSVEGNPKQEGQKIAGGMIPPLKADEIGQISYQAEEEGIYVFKVYQTPGLENRDVKEIWSEQVVVKCDEDYREQLEEEVNDETNIPNEEHNDTDLNNTEKQSSESDKGEKNSKENEGEKLDAGVIEDDNQKEKGMDEIEPMDSNGENANRIKDHPVQSNRGKVENE